MLHFCTFSVSSLLLPLLLTPPQVDCLSGMGVMYRAQANHQAAIGYLTKALEVGALAVSTGRLLRAHGWSCLHPWLAPLPLPHPLRFAPHACTAVHGSQ